MFFNKKKPVLYKLVTNRGYVYKIQSLWKNEWSQSIFTKY